MSDSLYTFLSLDLPPLLTALFTSLSAALLGNLLVLRRESLMGDAISHTVLPGIVLGFILSGTREPIPILLGASVAGILSALLIELISRVGEIEVGTAMGVVLSIFFALGIVLIEFASARNVDLDPGCILHGQLEHIFWLPPRSMFWSIDLLYLIPQEVVTACVCLLITIMFLYCFHKELILSSFDAELCHTLGYKPVFMQQLLMGFVAISVITSFQAVGSILVIAMLICPAAIARFYTDRYYTQSLLTGVFAVAIVLSGYGSAVYAPLLPGVDHSLSEAGMMASMAGVFLFLSVCFSPRYGLFARRKKLRQLQDRVNCEDVLGVLFRLHEADDDACLSEQDDWLQEMLGGQSAMQRALSFGASHGLLHMRNGEVFLTEAGLQEGRKHVRTHRLVEDYLVNEAGIRPDHVHEAAHMLEHYPDMVRDHIEQGASVPDTDPHGRPIPEESPDDDSSK